MPRPSVGDLPQHSQEGNAFNATSSVLTIKGDSEDKSDAPAVDETTLKLMEPKTPTIPAQQIVPRPLSTTKITPATLASPVTSPLFPPSAFTHRFTIVKPIGSVKPAAAPVRKGSSHAQGIIGWAFSAAGLHGGGNAASLAVSGGKGKKKGKPPKCEVCRAKVKGAGPHLQCDDCNCQWHPSAVSLHGFAG